MTHDLARIPPHNLDAERAVLGAVLLEHATAAPKLFELLAPTDFYTEAHRTLYVVMRTLFERAEPIDSITLSEALRRADQLAFVGGPAALALLEEQAAIASHLTAYAETIRELAILRELIQASTQAILQAYDAKGDVPQLVEDAERQIFALVERSRPSRLSAPQSLAQVLTDLCDTLDSPETDFVPLPVPELNSRLGGGLLRGEQLILGGRPGTSKTALVLQAATLAADYGHRVLVISREMKNVALGRRVLAQQTQVSATALRKRTLDADELRRISRALPRLAELPIWFDDQSRTIAQIRRRVRALRPRLLIVDYIQLVRAPEGTQNRRLEVTAVSKALKDFAMDFDCSVIGLSALRRPFQEKGKRPPPSLEDLKESGDIEADADVVVLLHQPDPDSTDRDLVIAKVRDGQAGGSITLAWDPTFVRFTEVPTVASVPGHDAAPSWVKE